MPLATTPGVEPQKKITILDAIEEAYKRGMDVPPDKAAIYDEAVKRGLVQDVRVGPMGQAVTDLQSLGEGAKNATVGLLNAPAAISRYARDKVGGAMGFKPEDLAAMDEAKSAYGIGTPQSTDTALQKVETVTGKHEPRNRRERYLRSIGESIPGMLMGGPASIPVRVAAAIGSGIGSEFGGEQLKDTPWEVPARIVGSFLGASLPSAVNRAVSPNLINDTRLGNIRTLTDAGVPTTAGQRTGSKALKMAEEELGGGATQRIGEQQNEAFTRAVGREVGMDSPRLGREQWQQAYQAVDDTFTALANRTHLPLDQTLQDDLINAVDRYHNLHGTLIPGPENQMNAIARLAGANGGVLTGPQYRNIITELRQMAEGNPALNTVVRDMRNALDSNIERNIDPALRAAWRQARERYANLMIVQDGMTKAGADTAEDLIKPHQLRSAVDQSVSDRHILSGDSRLGNLAKAGANVMAPIANSNTAGRQRMQALGATVLAAIGGAGGAATKDATTAMGGIALGAGLGIAAPLAVGRALMSRPVQAYLSNQYAPERGFDAAQKGIISLMNNNPQIRDMVVKLLEGGNAP